MNRKLMEFPTDEGGFRYIPFRIYQVRHTHTAWPLDVTRGPWLTELTASQPFSSLKIQVIQSNENLPPSMSTTSPFLPLLASSCHTASYDVQLVPVFLIFTVMATITASNVFQCLWAHCDHSWPSRACSVAECVVFGLSGGFGTKTPLVYHPAVNRGLSKVLPEGYWCQVVCTTSLHTHLSLLLNNQRFSFL